MNIEQLAAAIADRYRIEREIGAGGMATVYLADDLKHRRKVALKVLRPELAQAMGAERFLHEIETTANLRHPHILPLYDSGEAAGFLFYVMPYVEGESLRERLDREKQLPIPDALAIAREVAGALGYAHERGVVHRDIKPANIIYDPKKRIAKITDFGVACLTDASKTKTGTVLGSPYYMSPEQLAGKKVDGRADLFSLGVTLYQMLSAELPFKGESIANLMYNIANGKHPDIRRFRADLPNCVNNVVNKSLQKEAAERYQSGKQMAAAMKRCQEHIKEMEAA